MSDTQRTDIGLGSFSQELREASDEFTRTIEQEMLPMTRFLEEAFSGVARSIEDELAQAARSGKLSIKSMVNEVLGDLAKLAANQFIRQPLENVLGSIFSGNGLGGAFGGARAFGGFAASGNSFLVGERGPEIFVPGQSGRVMPFGANQMGGNVTINLNMGQTRDERRFRESEPQIAAALSRALSRARRNS